jgi:hypothetical protein
MMANPWEKSKTRLTPQGFLKRTWICDLDEVDPNQEIEACDLFNPFMWQHVRGRQLNDRSFASSLAEGDVVRIVRQCGSDPWDFDLVVRAILPVGAGIVMGLRGAQTDMARVVDAEKTAAAQRRQAAMKNAESMMVVDGGELR